MRKAKKTFLKRAYLKRSSRVRALDPMTGGSMLFLQRVYFATLLITMMSGAAIAAGHPLDPLSSDEIRIANQVVKSDRRLAVAAIPFITLEEPAKPDVLAWESRRAGQPAPVIPRRARLILALESGIVEAIVDLDSKRLISVVERKDVQGPVMGTEFMETSRIMLASPQFQDSLKTRGITDFSKVFCAPFTAGYYGIPEHEGKRILMVGCFDTRRTTHNNFGWPI